MRCPHALFCQAKRGSFITHHFILNHFSRLEIQLRRKTGVRYWSLLFGFKLLFNKKGTLRLKDSMTNIQSDSRLLTDKKFGTLVDTFFLQYF
jgi:hypothetical protein